MYDWLEEVYLLQNDSMEEAIDLVFDKIDELLEGGFFIECNQVLRHVEVDRLNSFLLVGFLSVLNSCKYELDEYPAFYNRVEEVLQRLDPKRVKSLLQGLER